MRTDPKGQRFLFSNLNLFFQNFFNFCVQVRQQFGLLRPVAKHGRFSGQPPADALHLGHHRSAGLPRLCRPHWPIWTPSHHRLLPRLWRARLHRHHLLPSKWFFFYFHHLLIGINFYIFSFEKGSFAWTTSTTCLVMLGKCFISVSFAIIYNYTAELFPTVSNGKKNQFFPFSNYSAQAPAWLGGVGIYYNLFMKGICTARVWFELFISTFILGDFKKIFFSFFFRQVVRSSAVGIGSTSARVSGCITPLVFLLVPRFLTSQSLASCCNEHLRVEHTTRFKFPPLMPRIKISWNVFQV